MKKFIKYNSNICDRVANELIIHVTKACPNSCSFCIDKLNMGVNHKGRPNFDAIKERILEYKDLSEDVVITGGEPLLFILDIDDLVKFIKEKTNLKVILNTSIPYECYLYPNIFKNIVNNCDQILFSFQHYDQIIGDKIRHSKSKFNRNEFYKNLENKDKYLVSINIFKPYFKSKEDILKNIEFVYNLGFNNIKLAELYDRPEMYVSISEMLGIKLQQPFAVGCSNKNVNISHLLPNFKGKLTIKTSCFLKSSNLKANFWDLLKMTTRNLFTHHKYFFGVIHPNGEIYPYWV